MTGKELEKIYNEAYRAVYWTAMSLLKNEADAEDIVQDTFVAFIESYSDITDTGKAAALLKKIAANKCLDRIKLAKTDNMEDEFFENVEAVPEDFLPDTIVESAEMRKIVMDIIDNSLSKDVRRTLILFYFNGMSTKEIAEALGIPQGTVLWRLNYAKKKIKKEVEKYEDENKTKLFGMAALPFLSKLFIKEAEQVPFKAMPASLTSTLSASAQASHAGTATKTALAAVKKGTGIIMKTKILIGSIAAVVAVSATVGIILSVMSRKADTEQKSEGVIAASGSDDQNVTDNAGNSADGSVEGSDEEKTKSPYYITVNNTDIRVGDNFDDISDDIGPELSCNEVADFFMYSYDGFQLTVDSDNNILGIRCYFNLGYIEDADITFAGELNGKSTRADVKKVLGEPLEEGTDQINYYSDTEAVYIGVFDNGTILDITISQK